MLRQPRRFRSLPAAFSLARSHLRVACCVPSSLARDVSTPRCWCSSRVWSSLMCSASKTSAPSRWLSSPSAIQRIVQRLTTARPRGAGTHRGARQPAHELVDRPERHDPAHRVEPCVVPIGRVGRGVDQCLRGRVRIAALQRPPHPVRRRADIRAAGAPVQPPRVQELRELSPGSCALGLREPQRRPRQRWKHRVGRALGDHRLDVGVGRPVRPQPVVGSGARRIAVECHEALAWREPHDDRPQQRRPA